jgi:hypothetical protein
MEETKSMYQAIGTLYAYVYKTENSYKLRVKTGEEYKLFVPKRSIKALDNQLISRSVLYCRVYPQVEQNIFFYLKGWNVDKPLGNQPGEFIFRGVHQKIPQFRYPVFSVYRNYEEGATYKGLTSLHLPILWKEEGKYKQAYKFIKDNKDNKPVLESIIVNFIPKLNTFGFSKRIEEPTTLLPKRYRRYSKDFKKSNSTTINENIKVDKVIKVEVETPDTTLKNPPTLKKVVK